MPPNPPTSRSKPQGLQQPDAVAVPTSVDTASHPRAGYQACMNQPPPRPKNPSYDQSILEENASQSNSARRYRVFIGNPGTGKSTIINCLIGKAVCDAGTSYGEGRTKLLAEHTHEGVIYMDTPGLADTAIRQQAARAIEDALKKDGEYQLFFVMRVNNGRAVAEDVLTFNAVLSALKTDSRQCGIIINQVKKKQYLQMKPGMEEWESVKESICSGEFKTDCIIVLPEIEGLDEEDNAVVKLPQPFVDFVEKKVESIYIPRTSVSEINTDVDAYKSQVKTLADIAKGLKRGKEEAKGNGNHQNSSQGKLKSWQYYRTRLRDQLTRCSRHLKPHQGNGNGERTSEDARLEHDDASNNSMDRKRD